MRVIICYIVSIIVLFAIVYKLTSIIVDKLFERDMKKMEEKRRK